MTAIKICGLTRAADVALCRELGADYLGFNFSAKSPRRVDPGRLSELRSAAGDTPRVGIFVDEAPDVIAAAVEAMDLDFVQIHREIDLRDLDLPRPVIAVSKVRGGAARLPDPAILERCRAILFDTEHADRPGGTGTAFDWTVLENRILPLPIGIAGGLNAGNVARAIAAVRPDFVDVASGVESSPGVKDAEKMRAFVVAVADAR